MSLYYGGVTCSIQCLKFKASTCRLHFGWECHCHRSKRYPPFERDLPPPLGITEVPGVLFPLLHSLCQRLDPRQLTPKTSTRGARKIEREARAPKAREFAGGETNSQFLVLNSCKAHTSSISCSYLVCDTDYLLLCVGKFFFHPTRTSFFFSSHVGQVFFSLLCVGQVFFFYL